MRQVISWRFVAAIGALVGLALFVNVAFADRGHDRRGGRAVGRRRPGGPTSSPSCWRPTTTASRCRRPVCPRATCTMTLVPDERTARVFAGTPGVDHVSTTSTSRAPCSPRRSGDTIMWFALVPMGPNFQFELPAIESLDGGYATLVNGWQVPYAPIIDRSRCEAIPGRVVLRVPPPRRPGPPGRLQPRPGRDHQRRLLSDRCWPHGPSPRPPTLRWRTQRFGRAIRSAMSSGRPYGRSARAAGPRRASTSRRSRTSRLTMRLVPAELAAISAASASTVASSSSSATARSTSPMASAVGGVDAPAGEHHLLGRRRADPLGQPDRHAPDRRQAPLAVGVAERGRRRRRRAGRTPAPARGHR